MEPLLMRRAALAKDSMACIFTVQRWTDIHPLESHTVVARLAITQIWWVSELSVTERLCMLDHRSHMQKHIRVPIDACR